MTNNIALKSINELLGMKFFIPSYQRGYRWTEQQVKDLLNDIQEFINTGQNGIYCIQPLVVKQREQDTLAQIKEANSIEEVKRLLSGSWEVIDGQQRLTTIKILLLFLDSDSYELEYQTRKGSNDFLNNVSQKGESEAGSNIDFYHMHQAYSTICNWFQGKDEFKSTFLETLKSKVQFIWYETKESDPIKVFTRLNIGKIALTDSELIKALFLNESNFKNQNQEAIRLQQIEIASEWDKIEYTLQNDEFWLFIQNELNYKKPTRIDYIFDLIRKQNKFGDCGDSGNDEHKTFRYFYNYFNNNKKDIDAEWLRRTWLTIKNYFQIFEEWYNDLEMYHYVGFLVQQNKKIENLITDYSGEKKRFTESLKDNIKDEIKHCKDLNRTYGDGGEKKRECFPLLLLFNIQTVINQNAELVKSDKYKIGTFYKFPFHLFKKEGKKKNGKGWEVEHIASNAGDDLDGDNQKIWLAAVKYSLPDGELKSKINEFLNTDVPSNFNELKAEIDKLDINPIVQQAKQKIWNYALLDSSTNEEYHNDPFPIKRICILTKDQGHKAKVSYNEEKKEIAIDKTESSIAFVPPCTKNVFTKAYTDNVTSFSAWSKADAKAYLLDINNVLSGADFIEDQKTEIEK